MTTLLAFLGAVLGGLILNVMPCVFPILSLKALGLARTGTSPAAARREALAYTAGVVSVCLALGAALIALRASGAAFGWAFQLQNPVVVGALAVLFAVLAFNLAGLYELPTPAFAGRAGQERRAPVAGVVALAGAFHLDDVGAQIGEQLPGPWPGEDAGEFEDADARERSGRGIGHRADVAGSRLDGTRRAP